MGVKPARDNYLMMGAVASIFAILLFLPLSQGAGQTRLLLGPFAKVDSANPCLVPQGASRFFCPVRRADIGWEEKDVFNPAAVVRGDTVFLFYRAQDSVGKPAGTSRIGLAWSTDGLRFTRQPEPVLYPDNDLMKRYEWEGGCEDPRIVMDETGRYVMTYSAFDSRMARMAIATSADLIHWRKEGLAFGGWKNDTRRFPSSKSGSIVSRWVNGMPVAVRINGRYWMYWGDWNIWLATSEDLVHWMPVEGPGGELVVALSPRKGSFDSRLVESGPPAMLTDSGIVFLYNSSNSGPGGDPDMPAGAYAGGQALFSKSDPALLLSRIAAPFIRPDRPYERAGQVHDVCFIEGLVQLRGTWLLYYGTADSRIAVAVSHAPNDPVRDGTGGRRE